MEREQSLSVPTDLVLAEVTRQRNTAFDEVAQWRALAQQIMAERDELAAEVELLRSGSTPDA
ncbi:hypothetical protein [Nonomuraea guangzhouensis]|uniref:Uncharacterized protein n=1 Tax=Nonomuraea guangzhouensis TaxID=1291555 RepID=A0ABW4GX10_9ACTN|nr:hypothetical protein [Nonomuraea guangzhouensis]